jgi:hypothetical protein
MMMTMMLVMAKEAMKLPPKSLNCALRTTSAHEKTGRENFRNQYSVVAG